MCINTGTYVAFIEWHVIFLYNREKRIFAL